MFKKVLLLILILLILGACSQRNSEEFEKAREVVLDYITTEGYGAPVFKKELWERATVEKITKEDIDPEEIDVNYNGSVIFEVSLNEKDSYASPRFLVDEDTEQVIGEMPGE